MLGQITRQINVLCESRLKWTWHPSITLAGAEGVFFSGDSMWYYFNYTSIHDGKVVMTDLCVMPLWPYHGYMKQTVTKPDITGCVILLQTYPHLHYESVCVIFLKKIMINYFKQATLKKKTCVFRGLIKCLLFDHKNCHELWFLDKGCVLNKRQDIFKPMLIKQELTHICATLEVIFSPVARFTNMVQL